MVPYKVNLLGSSYYLCWFRHNKLDAPFLWGKRGGGGGISGKWQMLSMPNLFVIAVPHKCQSLYVLKVHPSPEYRQNIKL